jgi:sensor histidine kinase YesM
VVILTEATCANDALEISVSNSYDPGVRSKKGEGIGLRNIRERLQIIYGNSSLLKIKDTKKNFTITLTIPQKNSLS